MTFMDEMRPLLPVFGLLVPLAVFVAVRTRAHHRERVRKAAEATADAAIPRLTLRQTQDAIALMEIGQPIRSFLDPALSVTACDGTTHYQFSANVLVPDASGIGRTRINFLLYVSRSRLKTPRDAQRVMRSHLHYVMEHEIDESIRIAGVKVFDPHSGQS